MAISRTDTLHEELAMILMDVFSILASVGFIMVLLIILISDYKPPPPGLTELKFHPYEMFAENDAFSPVRDKITKTILQNLNINPDRQSVEVKKTATLSYDGTKLIDDFSGEVIDFSGSGNAISYFDAAIMENEKVGFIRLLFFPEIKVRGVLYEQCMVAIPITDVKPGSGEYAGSWFVTKPTITIYQQDESGKYGYLKDILKTDQPGLLEYFFDNFMQSLNSRGKR